MNLVRGVQWSLLAALLCSALSACDGGRSAHEGAFGSSVTAMDHDPSDTFVGKVFVNGRWVGEASGGGGIVPGGISLSRKWRPGVSAVVKWKRCEPYGKNCRWVEKVVPIHPYEHVGATWLHILADDQVLIIPSMLGPGHLEYAGPDLPDKNFFSRGGDV